MTFIETIPAQYTQTARINVAAIVAVKKRADTMSETGNTVVYCTGGHEFTTNETTTEFIARLDRMTEATS